jgi:predicted PolB exonuclease-like 3'-5' exonuclease
MKEQYLVFDLETIGEDFNELKDSQKEYITRFTQTEEERLKKISEMALSPISGKIICTGLLFISGEEGSEPLPLTYCVDKSITDDSIKDTKYLPSGAKCFISNEKRMLEEFWRIFEKYPNIKLVSFNGRNFDAPYLMLRSAIHRIRPSRNLMSGTKFSYDKHIDLADELTFFNPSNYGGTKRFNFDYYSYAFGIPSPKGAGIDGSKVGQFYEEGKIEDIAEYCLRDVVATWELFKIWKEYLCFK